MTARQRWLFPMFVVSGFSGILYQVVWVRLAMASFGVISPVLSTVVSVFMLGLALGSWLSGRWIGPLCRRTGISAIVYYGLTELVIGSSALCIPRLFDWGRQILYATGTMNSALYLSLSAGLLSCIILPFCVAMGATFPLAMAFVEEDAERHPASFSALYVANVIGAMVGCLVTAMILIEILGFRQTLWVGGAGNLLVALMSFALAVRFNRRHLTEPASGVPAVATMSDEPDRSWGRLGLLFLTGFCSMGLEVVWVRAFTYVLATTVYAFASIVFVYLLATWNGSLLYRWQARRGSAWSLATLVALLSVFAIFPILAANPNWMLGYWWILGSIYPFCFALGYLTPKLMDEGSAGDPRRAGQLYAVNTLGCILGPLVASYGLMATIGLKMSLLVLSAPFVLLFFSQLGAFAAAPGLAVVALLATLGLGSYAVARGETYEEWLAGPDSVIYRDYAANTIADLSEGVLSVNGISMTHRTHVTKLMAHLPLAYVEPKPQSALVICLGIGATFRSLASWGIDTTAVELVPGVKKAFGDFFPDAAEIQSRPNARIVIDDGRRFLERVDRKYDCITIDPPPPISAAGSSLLMSPEFYALCKKRMTEHAVLQQWIPPEDMWTTQAVIRSIVASFPYVKVFAPYDQPRFHVVASMKPFRKLTADEWLARMPEAARADIHEWFSGTVTMEQYLAHVITREQPLEVFTEGVPLPMVTDDRPVNEYYFLRRTFYIW